ncbi:MAG: WD40/YVTN/BNR-like repeat-containing protein [Saprospiraceae bacterium]
MFQRQTRQSFPLPYIILLAIAAAALLIFAVKSTRQTPAPAAPESKADGSLRPDEWLAVMREYPHFKPSLAVLEQALRQASGDAAVQSRGGSPGFSAPWTVEGPGNIGARINSIKVHPTNPNIIYVGFSRGGVWKTTNGGATWLPIFDAQSFLNIGDIELDPQNPNIVYVGTGDLNIGSYVGIGDGLWRSNNGGQTWHNIGLVGTRIISKIIVHPTQQGTLFVATMGVPFERNAERGFFKTTNDGQTWQKLLFVSDQAGIIDLSMSPDNPQELFAASWDRIRTETETLVSGPNAKIWKSTSGGAIWQPLSTNLPGGIGENYGRIGLAQTPQNPNLLYALYVDRESRLSGIYRSTNRGANFTPVNIPETNNGGDVMGGFGWYFGKIWINPFDQNDLWVGGVELWRSRDGGENWEQATPPWWTYEVHADQHDMAFLDAQTFLLANDGGLYKTTDNAETWQDIENIPTTQFYRVAVNPHQPDWYFGGAQDNGTTGGNATETEWPRLYGGDGFQAAFHPDDPNIFYYETQNGGIVGTTDGFDFQGGTDGIEDGDRKHWDMQYFISQNDPDVMFTGTQRVYQSIGHTPNWFPISDDLTDGVVFQPRFHVITSICESTLDDDLLYVGTSDANVWRGLPNSQVWTNITAGLPERYVSSVKASPSSPNTVYVTHTGYRDNDFAPHIHRSNDRGATWKSIAGDLPNLAVNDVLILPGHADSVVFAGTDGGVYATLNGGKNWERLGTQMPVVSVFDLEINAATRRLVAGTYARSILTFPLDSLQLGNNVSAPAPPKNAPRLAVNPTLATDFVQVRLENWPTQQPTEIVVADLAGRVLRREKLPLGQSSLQMDARLFAPGAYLVFAQTGGRVAAQRKFVVGR